MHKIIIITLFFLGLSLTANATSIVECTPEPSIYLSGSIEQTQSVPGPIFYIKADGLHANTQLVCNSSDTCTGLDVGGSFVISGGIKRNSNGDIVGYIIHRDPNNLNFSVEFTCE